MKKLGTIVKDSATNLEGMLTHMVIDMDKQIKYLFQPKALDPETGKPVTRFWIVGSRIQNGIDVEVEMPYEVLGTEVEDIATGFKGIAIQICLHISGCVHVEINPIKILAKTGTTGEAIEMDIRRLKGPAIPVLSEEEIEESQKRKPSPEEHPPFNKMPEF